MLIFFERLEKNANFGCVSRQKSYFWLFQKKIIIFWRTKVIFLKQPTIWTFLEVLLFQLHYTANLLPSAIFDKIKFFFRKTHLFSKTAQFIWLFWEIYQIELQSTDLHSTANLPPSVNFEKLQLFRIILFFLDKTQLLNVLRNLTISFAFDIKLAIFNLFQKTQVSFSKKPSVFLNNPNFDLFEKSYCISCFLQQICYLSFFVKISIFLFGKPIYFFEKTQYLIVFRNLTVSFAFDIKLVNCSCFQFSEKWSFLSK